MSAYSGTNDKVNGGAMAGEFLTGNMDFFQMATLVPMAQTNVDTPVAYLYTQQGYSTWQPVTVINGAGVAITYSTQADYQDAFNKQSNLNLLIQLFATRANPVAISVSSQTVSNPASAGTLFTGFQYSTNFGSTYSSSMTVTTVKMATEKTYLWDVSASNFNSNATGYELLDVYQDIPVLDLATPVLSGTAAFNVSSATLRNLIAIRTTSL